MIIGKNIYLCCMMSKLNLFCNKFVPVVIEFPSFQIVGAGLNPKYGNRH